MATAVNTVPIPATGQLIMMTEQASGKAELQRNGMVALW